VTTLKLLTEIAILWAVVDNAINAQMLFSEALVNNETRPVSAKGKTNLNPVQPGLLDFVRPICSMLFRLQCL